MRIVYTIAFISLLAIYGSAQSNFTGGVIAGGSLSQITGDEAFGYNKPSYLIGVKAGYKFKSRLNLEVEFLYNTKGSSRGRPFN